MSIITHVNGTTVPDMVAAGDAREPFAAGQCQQCGFVNAAEGGYPRTAPCAACHNPVRLTVVKGTFSNAHNCDDACLFARKDDCVCQCGGENHRRGYLVWTLVPAGIRDRDEAEWLARKERVAAKARADRESAATALEDLRCEWLDAIDDRGEVIAWLNGKSDELRGEMTSFADFILDLAVTFERNGELTAGQEDAVRRLMAREAARAAAAALPRTNAPSGRTALSGTIIKVADKPSEYRYNGTDWKMTVRDDRGFAVWMTCPRAVISAAMSRQRDLWDAQNERYRARLAAAEDEATVRAERAAEADPAPSWTALLVGHRITLTANLTPKEDDLTFAFGKSPTKVQLAAWED